MSGIKRTTTTFRKATDGSVAIVSAVMMVVMMMAAGIAVDYVGMIRHHSALQAAADAAAVAGAREFSLANADAAQIEAVASNFARTNLGLGLQDSKSGDQTDSGSAPLSNQMSTQMMSAAQDGSGGDGGGGGGSGGGGSGSIDITATLNAGDSSVLVEIEKTYTPYFAGFLPKRLYTINATARAQVVGSGNICLLTLNPNEMEALHFAEDSRMTANGCAIISNSTDPSGIQIDLGAKIHATAICSAGGVNSYSAAATSTEPVTDCPPVPDPLQDRPAPSVGKCDHHKTVIKGGVATLMPGVYCQGLTITKNAQVRLLPGVYIIRGSALVATDTSQIIGDNVGFYMAQGSAFSFSKQTTIELTAPKDGPMAGLLFFEDRVQGGKQHVITSDNARILTGTIYLPIGELKIDAKEPLADQSAYTAIIASEVKLKEGPNLVLNSNYGATDIPVPAGLTASGGRIVLKQ